jgi:hypothetical protein
MLEAGTACRAVQPRADLGYSGILMRRRYIAFNMSKIPDGCRQELCF